ncbi:MAG: alpha/beta fold hydrolase [Candidatus Pacearchaeota archaeon]|jgi:esterase/lipase
MVDPNSKSINLHANSNKEFFLIHGYTGSPTDFNGLGEYLNKRFNANVRIILLKGHGTKISDLDKIQYNDFRKQVEEEFLKDFNKGRKIVVGGISFGGQLALYLASKYPVAGVFNTATPYRLRFPILSWGIYNLKSIKKYWAKGLYDLMYKDPGNAFYYKQFHVNIFEILKESLSDFNIFAKKVVSPFLTLHSKYDYLSDFRSVFIMEGKINSKVKKNIIFNSVYHNLFFSDDKDKAMKIIGDFFEEQHVFDKKIPIHKRIWHKIRHNIKSSIKD